VRALLKFLTHCRSSAGGTLHAGALYLNDFQEIAEVRVEHFPKFLDALRSLLSEHFHRGCEPTNIDEKEGGFHALRSEAGFCRVSQPPVLDETLDHTLRQKCSQGHQMAVLHGD